MKSPQRLSLVSWPWPDVASGDDLTDLVCGCPDLREDDIVIVTSKVVSKAEGRATAAARVDVVARDTARVVARKGHTVIAQTSHGLVLAAAGVDASNVPPGQALALPVDPDASARRLRSGVLERRGINVAVVVTDTAGRAWRVGQTDIAIGCAGIEPVDDLAGTTDPYGNRLAVTATVVADEVAAAADLVKGKFSGRPLAVLRGFEGLVLPPGEHGPGATAIIRHSDTDMFGLGARDAVIAAAGRDLDAAANVPAVTRDDAPPFAAVLSAHPSVRLSVSALAAESGSPGWECRLDAHEDAPIEAWMELGRLSERIEMLAWAHRMRPERLDPDVSPDTGWATVSRTHWIVA